MRTSFDVAIAGGGIVGASCAAECAAAGLSVFVAEPSVIGGGATAAGMGHLVVMDDSPAQIALTNYSRNLVDRARSAPPRRCRIPQCRHALGRRGRRRDGRSRTQTRRL